MQANGRKRLKVLFLAHEWPMWLRARSWTYNITLGFEEGFAASGVSFTTVTTTWNGRLRELVPGNGYDQVWFEAVHSGLSDDQLDWLTSLAPVRVALIAESCNIGGSDDPAFTPELTSYRTHIERSLRCATHVLAVDEKDAAEFDARPGLRGAWCPTCVPARFVRPAPSAREQRPALWSGAAYGNRAQWFGALQAQGLVRYYMSYETKLRLDRAYDWLHRAADRAARSRLPAAWGFGAYLHCLRQLRRLCFWLYWSGLRAGLASINLPSMLKAYTGRVVESMAAGRPVLSWRIPDRPRNLALFEDGKEILLFPTDNLDVLAEQIRRLQREPGFADRIAAAARRKLRRWHTTEQRVRQVLDWIETGDAPSYD
jgi:hypothetical protein